MSRLTASGLWRAAKCPGSAALPETPRLFADAERGRAEHATLERDPPPGGDAEVAFAYNVATGGARVIGKRMERNYSGRGPTEITGTADVVFVEPDRVRILDYKTGYGYDAATPHPRENLQLRFLTLAAARAYGKTAARAEIERTDTGSVQAADFDAFDLAETAETLKSIWRAVERAERDVTEGRQPRVQSGDHCWRCACIQRCPAYTELACTFATGMGPQVLPDRELTPERIAAGWPTYLAAKRLLGEFHRAVSVFIAHNGPIPLGDGKVLDEREQVRESLDGMVARNVLRAQHGDAVADAACTIETSKAAIERALLPLATKRGDKARLMRTALEAIEQANGVTRKRTKVLDVFNEPGANALPAKTEEAA